MVSEYFPKYEKQPEPELSNELKIRIWKANDKWTPEFANEGFPQKGIQVIIYEALQNNECGTALDTLTTNKDGYVTFTHKKENLAYKVLPNDSLTSFYQGYYVMGVFMSQAEVDEWARPVWGSFKPGDYKLNDLNADGRIDKNDTITDEEAYVTFVNFNEDNRIVETDAYMVKKENIIEPDYEAELNLFKREWNSESLIRYLSEKDAYLYNSKHIEDYKWYEISDSIWRCSEKLLISFDRCKKLFTNAPVEYHNMWLQEVAYSRYGVERLFIYTLLNQYYKGVPIINTEQNYSSREEGIAYLQQEFDMTMQYIPKDYECALNMFMARFYLSTKQYNEAYEASKRIVKEIDISSISTVFTLGNYQIQPNDILLVYAEAALNIGNTIEALQNVNRIAINHGLAPFLPQGASVDEIKNCILEIYQNGVNGKYRPNGGMMKYAETSRFKNDQYGTLPFPQWLININSNITQNPKW